ncbi:S46 family peptidase, partial [Arthrospira platensis SPKY1]|nr:S46 family peptidase [Arthrospira platensis SPKY1]
LIPELQVAYFGGDYDNFTYPRYNLDFTLWRAYDENGQPVNSSEFYFPFNTDGIEEGTPVFVTGTPGRTERYRTLAQLEYDRDYRYRIQLDWLRNRSAILQKQFDETGDRDLQEMIFGIN